MLHINHKKNSKISVGTVNRKQFQKMEMTRALFTRKKKKAKANPKVGSLLSNNF